MVLQDSTMCRRGPPRIVPISHYFMRRKRSLLCRARAKLLCNYPRRILEGIQGGGGGRWQGQVMHRHRLRVWIRALRKDEVGRSMILRYYGVSVRPFFVTSTRKFPSRLVFMYEKYAARMDDDEVAAAAASCAMHLSFWRQRFA